MTRYFFQFVTPRKAYIDDRGEEFESLADAHDHARAVACELARNHSTDRLAGEAVVVRDAAGSELLRVPLVAHVDTDAGNALQHPAPRAGGETEFCRKAFTSP